MFNNLVECAKTKKDNKRWAYFVVTSTIWTLALTGSIIGGIFLYDAKLDEQLSVLTMLIAPPPPPAPPPPAATTVSKPQPSQPTTSNVPTATRLEHIESAADIKARPAANLVNVSTSGLAGVEGGMEGGVNGGQIGGVLDGVINSTGNADAPPPPKPDLVVAEPEVEKPKQSLIRRSEGVLRGNTLTQVRPEYPQIARTANVTGEVKIDILIGEDGNVSSASIISGHPLLQQAALRAAKQWKFNPTLLNGTPVKVQGVLTFRFTM